MLDESHDQSDFIKNWNLLADTFKELKLPILENEGACHGLVYCLASYINRGEEKQFFENYSFIINKSNALFELFLRYQELNKRYQELNKMSEEKEKQELISRAEEFSRAEELMKFAIEIKTLQELQLMSFSDPKSNDKFRNSCKRIGAEIEKMDHLVLIDDKTSPDDERFDNLREAANNLKENQQIIFGMRGYKGSRVFLHSLMLYKFNENGNIRYAFFDPDDPKKGTAYTRYFDNPVKAVNFIIERLKHLMQEFGKVSIPNGSFAIETTFFTIKKTLSKKVEHTYTLLSNSELQNKNLEEMEDEEKKNTLNRGWYKEKIYQMLRQKNMTSENIERRLNFLKGGPLEQMDLIQEIFDEIKNNSDQKYQPSKNYPKLLSKVVNTEINSEQKKHLDLLKRAYFQIFSELMKHPLTSRDIMQQAVNLVEKPDCLIHYQTHIKRTTDTTGKVNALITNAKKDGLLPVDSTENKSPKQ